MDKKYFEENVVKCNKCGSIPTIVTETPLMSLNGKETRYRVVCWECKWEDGEYGNKTGLCLSPENALEAWNKKMKQCK